MTVDLKKVFEIFPPRTNYYGYVSSSSYMRVGSYRRELKRLRSRDRFRIYGEPYPAMFEAAREMGFLILETDEDRDRYKIYMLLKKRDAQKYMKEFSETKPEEKQEPVQFDIKDLWSTKAA